MESLWAPVPPRLRVRGSVVVFQQRISLRLFVGGGLSLIVAGLLWVAGVALATVVTLLALSGGFQLLVFEVSWSGRSALAWAALSVATLLAPRVLALQPERVTLTADAGPVTPLPVQWAGRSPSGERHVDAPW
jgi:hypothetical protein